MGWDFLLFGVFAVVGVGATIVALTRGVTWGNWGDDTLRRKTNPVGFWIMTAMWMAAGAGGIFGLWRLLAEG